MNRILAAVALSAMFATPAFACGMRMAPSKAIALNDMMKQINEAEEKVQAKTEAAPVEEKKAAATADAQQPVVIAEIKDADAKVEPSDDKNS